ncbi:MAG: hypothetical protein GY800_01260 [Planctomycetes bacterium]|nr:hypothetical protein [Planctomycetota bacterium]
MCFEIKINGRKLYTTILLVAFTAFLTVMPFSGPLYAGKTDEKKKPERESNEELKKLMEEIDKHYKAAQERMGYYALSKSDWDTLLKAGKVITKLSDRTLKEFVPPDDKEYLKLTKEMQKRSAEIYKAANEKYVGAYEDIQYSFGRLRNSCKNCHNHLGIQLYTNLYPGETPPK